jgi:hypothetical protein
MSTTSTPRELMKLAQRLLDNDPQELLRQVAEQWPAMTDRVEPEDAETCRLAMLAASLGGPAPAHEIALWRTRGLTRAALCGWTEGAGALIMSEAFRVLSAANDDYEQGRTIDVIRPSAQAYDMLQELGHIAAYPASGHDFGPTPDVIRRFWHEKSGFMLCVADDLAAAAARYALAFETAQGNVRGALKVRAGALLVDYLIDLSGGGDGAAQAEETAGIAERAADDQPDVARDAQRNAAVMRERGRALQPYEML